MQPNSVQFRRAGLVGLACSHAIQELDHPVAAPPDAASPRHATPTPEANPLVRCAELLPLPCRSAGAEKSLARSSRPGRLAAGLQARSDRWRPPHPTRPETFGAPVEQVISPAK
ncbi:hypothetical protein PVAP13_1KG368505 [Panicum virgatum]|uniref:Uncharacterized protein n=1 Tax=Panicum virgatum TaxID=38727 RepID=A0A8T0XDG2_PANVG|nr:hypothetical protein PVAP13_1KG368505 [Panicum virgatum]